MANIEGILATKGSSVIAIDPEWTVLEAARLMNAKRIGALVVIEHGDLVGILSERDILVRSVAAHRDPCEVHVREVMTAPVVCCAPDTELAEVSRIMTEQRIRHLPVIENGHLAGIVASGDIMAWEISEGHSTIESLFTYIHGPAVHLSA